jgi:hypothetical protein
MHMHSTNICIYSIKIQYILKDRERRPESELSLIQFCSDFDPFPNQTPTHSKPQTFNTSARRQLVTGYTQDVTWNTPGKTGSETGENTLWRNTMQKNRPGRFWDCSNRPSWFAVLWGWFIVHEASLLFKPAWPVLGTIQTGLAGFL